MFVFKLSCLFYFLVDIPLFALEESKINHRNQIFPTKGRPPLGFFNRAEPKVVIISYGRKGKSTSTERDSETQLHHFIKPLKDCGVTLELLDDVPLDRIELELNSRIIPKNSPVLINAHGVLENPYTKKKKYKVGSEHSSQNYVDGNKLISNVQKALPNSPIWLGTCNAGACKATNCVGAECKKGSIANEKLFAWQALSHLICDSIKGDCKLWEKWDPKGEGVIRPDKLTEYLSQLPRTFTSRIHFGYDHVGLAKLPLETAKEDFNKHYVNPVKNQCEEIGGKFRVLNYKYAWGTVPSYIEHDGSKISFEYSVIDFTFDDGINDLTVAKERIKKKYSDFPKSCGEVPYKKTQAKRFDCELKVSIQAEMECENPTKPAFQKSPNSTHTYTPQVRDFKLESDRCRAIINAKKVALPIFPK